MCCARSCQQFSLLSNVASTFPVVGWIQGRDISFGIRVHVALGRLSELTSWIFIHLATHPNVKSLSHTLSLSSHFLCRFSLFSSYQRRIFILYFSGTDLLDLSLLLFFFRPLENCLSLPSSWVTAGVRLRLVKNFQDGHTRQHSRYHSPSVVIEDDSGV